MHALAGRRNTVVLCVIRCGETTWARENRIAGAADLPLSDTGRAMVREDSQWAIHHRVATIYHPADEAAQATAAAFAETMKGRAKVAEDLADPHLGLLEGLTEQDFAERYSKRYKQWQDDPLSLSPPDGEHVQEARSRIFRAIARLLRRSRSDELAVVLHPIALGLLRCWASDLPPSELWRLLEDRPRVERYVFGMEMIAWLEEAAEPEYARS